MSDRLKLNYGDQVEWDTPCPKGKKKRHSGVVIEVVPAGETPKKAGDWVFTPRNHESYVVEDRFYTSTFWPRVTWFVKAEE